MAASESRKIDPDRILYDLDVSLVRDLLGRPGRPEKHVKSMLDKIAELGTERSQETTLRQQAQQLLEDAAKDLTSPDFAALAEIAAVGFIFNGAVHKMDQKNSALDVAMKKAFAVAKLDPRSPLDWYLLLSRLCWAHFGEFGKPGRANKIWSAEQYGDLLRSIHAAKLKTQNQTDAEAIRELVRTKTYNISPSHLKKALREARDPKCNRDLIRPMYEALTAELDRRGSTWSSEEDKILRAQFAREEADRIGAS